MATAQSNTFWRQSLVLRLTGVLALAGIIIIAFSAYIYVQIIAPIEDPAVQAEVTSAFVGLILAALISLVLVGVTFGSNTAISLRLLSSKAREMERGEMDVSLETSRTDEIGELAGALDSMRDSLQNRIETAERRRQETERLNRHLQSKAEHYDEVLTRVIDGDLSQRVDSDSESEAIEAIGNSINLTIAELQETTTDISRELENLSATAEEVAASAESVADTSARAADAGQVGREAATSAIDDVDAVEAATEAAVEEIERLEGEMEAINEIVRVIGEIAQKTNILAVNARIESSRTADAGQGYSVVADEVRELAEETKNAAEDAEQRIERLQSETAARSSEIRDVSERTTETATTVRKALTSLEEIAELVDDVDSTIENITEATDEQAQGIQAVATRVDALSSIGSDDGESVAFGSTQTMADGGVSR